ncbi:MAG: hypothetical protein JWM19_2218, partial [Actinomycetia bacterium]|nr:hypothetical protein [Actinomycetes bacterium]
VTVTGVSRQIVDPEECLRSVTDEAVRQAEAGKLVLHCTLGVRAAANALVLLGLLPERRADKVLHDYQEALSDRSLGTAWGLTEGELPVHSGVGDIWEAHVTGPQPLPEMPQAMAVAAASFPATISGLKADLRFEWVTLADGQWRVTFRAAADDPGGEPDRPSVVMREALALITVTDDTGYRYRPRVEGVTWERVAAGRQEWRGEFVADQNPDVPGPASLTISSAESGTAETVPLAAGEGGTDDGARVPLTAPRWPTPAEGYLAALATVDRIRVGWTDLEADKTAEIVAIVADCLLAVGALPPGSTLLRASQEGMAPTWRDALAARWARRAHLSGVAAAGARHEVLLARLPFEHASALIESVSVADTSAGRVVGVRLHGSPWVPAAPWPVIAPCFKVHATDANGTTSEGILEGFRPAGDGTRPGQSAAPAGRGTFWLWPPVPEGAAGLSITVSTLWEAATAGVTFAAGAPTTAPAVTGD